MKLLSVIGTRPEAIKMAPVVLKLAADSRFDARVCVTAQHREMLDQVLDLFEITPDYDLNIMSGEQDLTDVTSAVIQGMRDVLCQFSPDIVLVHGDTATTLGATLSAFYHKIPVAHVEAGLRSGNLDLPWPEEANRKLTSVIATLHFAPTGDNRKNLLLEGTDPAHIKVTGNTVVDALNIMTSKLDASPQTEQMFRDRFSFLTDDRRLMLVTGHRRESFGKGFERICQALLMISRTYPDLDIMYPVHLNPEVHEPVNRLLSGVQNIHLTEPLGYLPFVHLMKRAYLILTDSGGIQEEAVSLGKPVLVMRDATERPEAVTSCGAKLIGTHVDNIVSSVSRLLEDPELYQSMIASHNPYGDGKASSRIVRAILGFLEERVS